MNFYFVYSSGGGGGDWNGINRIFTENMPEHFKENILIKFGDIFFNHKGLNTILKPQNWKNINDARKWLYERTNEKIVLSSKNIILDVGTTKIINYINSHNPDYSPEQIITEFDNILKQNKILEKYATFILGSKINNAITFDIPNPFKIRNQTGATKRSIFNEENIKPALAQKSVEYANKTYELLGNNSNSLMTIVPAFLNKKELQAYFSDLNYKPKKIAIGALIDLSKSEFIKTLENLKLSLPLKSFERVHFLGCGGIDKANIIKAILGNQSNFSVDNTTAYNRSIDGNTKGTSVSKYYDYTTKKMFDIKEENLKDILEMHKKATYKYFSDAEMLEILNGILLFQSGKSPSPEFSYNTRGKLIIHNFDVFRENAN